MATSTARSMPASVAAVCRVAHPELEALGHVIATLDALLDYSVRWSFERACELGDVRLLERIASREAPELTFYIQHEQFHRGILSAAKKGNLAAVRWVRQHYLPEVGLGPRHVDAAMQSGDIATIDELLRAAGNSTLLPHREDEYILRAIESDNLQLARYLFRRLDGKRTVSAQYPVRYPGKNAEMLQWIQDSFQFAIRFEPASDISSSEYLAILQDAHKRKTLGSRFRGTMDEAAGSGHLEVVQWLHETQLCSTSSLAMDKAAANGHLHVLKWLYEYRKQSCSESTARCAAENGHLEIVQWLYDKYRDACTVAVLVAAVSQGHLQIVKWLYERDINQVAWPAIASAAVFGGLETLQWLSERYPEKNTSVGGLYSIDVAASSGQLAIVQWLHVNRTDGCSRAAMTNAARNGHLEVVEWLHLNRSEGCSTAAMDTAAENGHLHVVKWLHENRSEGCTVAAMDSAARNGHLDVLEYLYEVRSEGCSEKALASAVEFGKLAVVQWLCEHYSGRFDLVRVRNQNRRARQDFYYIIHWIDDYMRLQPVAR